MSNYNLKIQKAMKILSKNKNVIFLGQSVVYPGNLIFKSLAEINNKKKIELPVFEETQMGMSLGLSLCGFIPVTCFPRFDFLLCGMNQLVNHLDKLEIISKNIYIPKVIIRVLVGSKKNINAGEQHTQNYVREFKKILKTIDVYDLKNSENIIFNYKKALKSKRSSLFVEYSDLY